GVCHQAVSSPDVCSNCHMSSPHHDTEWANQGDCAHCHVVPAWAQDRPAQAACRECHGSNQHDKGGPIQNFAACAACHNQDPFHAKPSGPLGYTRTTNNGKLTGKGKFAIWWDLMTDGGRNRVREDVSPNGDDMGDKGGHDRWENPSLSFNMYSIEHNGKAYQVPGFSPPADYTTGDLGTCTSCHSDKQALVSCDNPKWTMHLSSGYVNQATAQLAEATYIGSLCVVTPPPPPVVSNLALNKTASSSRSEGSSYSAAKAVDGNSSSYWYARSSSEEWLKVDLGQSTSISKVVIIWNTSQYAEEYEVRVSTDNSNWTRVKDENYGNGGTDQVSFSSRNARYVQIRCQKERRDGYGIHELEVYK
ncbi:MAG TPA: discoidin domain-containing protein, partial [Malonomonas sp.]